MSYCIVNGCFNRTKKKNHMQLKLESETKKISFHRYASLILDCKESITFNRFPKCPEKWLASLKLQNCNIPATARVCSSHFKVSDYETGLSLPRLRRDAVPFVSISKDFSFVLLSAFLNHL